MRLAALWDMSTGTFFADQDWQHQAEEDGTRPSCWEAVVQREAQICLLGLQNMHSYHTGMQDHAQLSGGGSCSNSGWL